MTQFITSPPPSGHTVHYRYGSEPTAMGIVSVRTRYVAVSPFDGATLTPYRSHVFHERRYYTVLHVAGLVAFTLAFALGGCAMAVPR